MNSRMAKRLHRKALQNAQMEGRPLMRGEVRRLKRNYMRLRSKAWEPIYVDWLQAILDRPFYPRGVFKGY